MATAVNKPKPLDDSFETPNGTLEIKIIRTMESNVPFINFFGISARLLTESGEIKMEYSVANPTFEFDPPEREDEIIEALKQLIYDKDYSAYMHVIMQKYRESK